MECKALVAKSVPLPLSYYGVREVVPVMTPCGKDDDERPMVFRGLPYCSENHRKEIEKREARKESQEG